MAIRVALNHQTRYLYDDLVAIFPQVVRLRPCPHSRTPILSYSLKVTPEEHFLNWQQDPQGNYQARLVFPKKARALTVEVDLVAEMAVINPFDFFLEPWAEEFPFQYDAGLKEELKPYLVKQPAGAALEAWLADFSLEKRRTVDFLVQLNQVVQRDIGYVIRMEPGVQSCEETLIRRKGSCRDSAWLLVQALRHLGLAARFVSGYLIQLAPDIKPLDGPVGPAADFTDLHAWAEVYLPGAGWVGLDPTSGLMAGEGHIPLACTPEPGSAAPISGAVELCEAKFEFSISIARIHEDPRVTRPYSDDQWRQIEALGHRIDGDLEASAVRLTMGGEPTFVAVDNMDAPEWNIAALGPQKHRLAGQLIKLLRSRFAPQGGFLHYGQGKWYPGEPLPRWALSCYWRLDGQPIWNNPDLIADPEQPSRCEAGRAEEFVQRLTARLGLGDEAIIPAYEDPWHYLLKERRLPVNVDPLDSKLSDPVERENLSRIFEQGLSAVVGYVLPLKPADDGRVGWTTGSWPLRQSRLYLMPGDSPIGYRLPIDSLPWTVNAEWEQPLELDPLAPRAALPRDDSFTTDAVDTAPDPSVSKGAAPSSDSNGNGHSHGSGYYPTEYPRHSGGGNNSNARGNAYEPVLQSSRAAVAEKAEDVATAPDRLALAAQSSRQIAMGQPMPGVVRTALCVEVRHGQLHVFLPPVARLEDYLALVAQVEQTAAELDQPVVVEGYSPPHDYRVQHIKLTPDPGVIEVNVHPAHNWHELVASTTALYDLARRCGLGTEKFNLDGRHTGTGGGNHIVIGGSTPADSPILRRPDLLRSLLGYWHNHPSLSYLFSGQFVGPTSQAPRVDEARHDSLYELEIAFAQIPESGSGEFCPPWLVDRVFRHLLVDVTGNTHRAEFCIDKLFSPDSSTGRLGLVEFRGFEMPPHARMSLTQQLLLRALIAWFWKTPYRKPLTRWGTSLHDRFLLPHFVRQDFGDVLGELRVAGYHLHEEWFEPHLEFRFPTIGSVVYGGVQLELRHAIEPWNTLGEEPGAGGVARYVDTSVERIQVKVSGMTDSRHTVTCNGRRLPLHPTGVAGEFVAAVRFRAWQPPSCLHPTIPVQSPLVFDVVDTWSERSIGGCTWHVSNPGGLASDVFPINANAAETRRMARFFKFGHTPGPVTIAPEPCNREFPLTLDLRRGR